MIVNRYKGIKKYFLNDTIGRRMVYCIVKPFQKMLVNRKINNEVLFSEVEIETINRCNGVCPFCPINRNEDTREFAKMEEKLFKKIIDELGAINYSGRLALFSNNEPFIDERIIDFAKYAREKCSKAYIHLYTNGKLLTEEKLCSIINYLDCLVIDNYNDALELNPASIMALEFIKKNPKLDKKIEIHLRKLNEVLYTRGGQSPNNQKQKVLKMPCLRIVNQLIIRPTGAISLCCNDALGKYTLGDCNKQSLVEIWKSEIHKNLEKKIASGRENVELCKYCDSFSFK